MSHIEFEGKVYCDWRLSIHDCEESNFFNTVFTYCAVISGLEGLGMFGCLVIRKILLGESWRGFLKGESRFHLSTFTIYLTHFVLTVCLLCGVRFPITGILWTFLCSSQFLSEGAFVATTSQALPDSLEAENKSWSITHTVRGKLLYAHTLFTSVLHIVILSTAYSLYDSMPHVGRVLEKVGLTLTSVNSIIIIIAHVIGPYLLKRRIQELLRETNDYFRKGEINTSLLKVTNTKLSQVLFFGFSTNTLIAINYLLLAFCPFYFTNLTMSKTILLITFPINFTSAIFYPYLCIYFDLKKWQAKEHSTKGSKKDESSIVQNQAESQIQSQSQSQSPNRYSFAGGKEVELIIRDLTEKTTVPS